MIKTAILTPTATYTIQSCDSLVDLWLVPSFPVSLLLDLDLSTTTWYNAHYLWYWYKQSQLSDLIYRWKHEKMNIRVKRTLVNVTLPCRQWIQCPMRWWNFSWIFTLKVVIHCSYSYIRQQSHLRFFHRIATTRLLLLQTQVKPGAGIRSSTKSNSLFWMS